jgi:hypothetical protein
MTHCRKVGLAHWAYSFPFLFDTEALLKLRRIENYVETASSNFFGQIIRSTTHISIKDKKEEHSRQAETQVHTERTPSEAATVTTVDDH